ncbi:MAG TPA: methyltransferase domain-containing protein [Dehalococcoidia bacterium]|nr:methyltransferase domain-containing protein [Dehalococcoidia bacterium]
MADPARASSRGTSRVQDSFGPNAEKYVTSPSHANPAELQRLVDRVRPRGGRFLDLATGAGHCGLAFAPHVDEVVLADLTPEMLAVAARQAADRGLTNVSTREVDVAALPFDDGEFDYLSCRIAAHHFPDQPAAFAEMFRVLRPSGTLLFVDNVVPEDPEAADFINRYEVIRDPSHARCYSLAELTRQLAAAGFEVAETATRRKQMDLRAWTDRLNVAPADLARLEAMLDGVAGPARESLAPRTVDGRRIFDLIEATIIGRRPEPVQ